MRVPPVLARNAREVWGADGDRWLAYLPRQLEYLAASWELELGDPYPMSYNWVCRATTADGTAAVLKVGLAELPREATVLRAWDGRGAVRLLRAQDGALLLERADPGAPASALVPTLAPDGDEQATAAAVGVLRELHAAQPPTGGPPTLTEHLADLDVHLADPIRDRLVPHDLVGRAAGVASELLASAPALLHGDLHHDNLVRSGDDWRAIDPHGVVGDPGYEVGAWLYNPLHLTEAAVPLLVPARVEQYADGLGQPLDRVVAWGFVQAVLSAVWTANTGVAPQDRTLDVAALLAPRLA